ncbi:hypothetical protein K7432_010876 [Basidiobolus ranarum]|uniref:Uncharacterized protein n=1 Tax=Basidiobolus ranarum TaxID=34480 RepID=A0ABR2WN16_9FUNG
MKNITDVRNKIVEQEQKAAANFILNIIVSIMEIAAAEKRDDNVEPLKHLDLKD